MQATGNYVLLKMEEVETVKNGFIIPETNRQHLGTAEVVSVGQLVKDTDERIKSGEKVVINADAGREFPSKLMDSEGNYKIVEAKDILAII